MAAPPDLFVLSDEVDAQQKALDRRRSGRGSQLDAQRSRHRAASALLGGGSYFGVGHSGGGSSVPPSPRRNRGSNALSPTNPALSPRSRPFASSVRSNLSSRRQSRGGSFGDVVEAAMLHHRESAAGSAPPPLMSSSGRVQSPGPLQRCSSSMSDAAAPHGPPHGLPPLVGSRSSLGASGGMAGLHGGHLPAQMRLPKVGRSSPRRSVVVVNAQADTHDDTGDAAADAAALLSHTPSIGSYAPPDETQDAGAGAVVHNGERRGTDVVPPEEGVPEQPVDATDMSDTAGYGPQPLARFGSLDEIPAHIQAVGSGGSHAQAPFASSALPDPDLLDHPRTASNAFGASNVAGLPAHVAERLENAAAAAAEEESGVYDVEACEPPSSFFFLSHTLGLRVWSLALIQNWWFHQAILVCIVVNSVLLALDQPGLSNPAWLDMTLRVSEYVFTGVFFLEMVFKLIALGFVLHPGAYMRNPWNVLDIIIVTGSLVTIVFDTGNLSALRVVRVLRPLRSVSRVAKLRILIQGLFRALPSVVNTFMLFAFVIVLYAIAGTQLWMGHLDRRCYVVEAAWANASTTSASSSSGPPALPAEYRNLSLPLLRQDTFRWPCASRCDNVLNADGVELRAECLATSQFEARNLHFDNFLGAVLLVLKAMSMDNWPDDLADALRYTEDLQAIIFFISLTTIGGYCCVNLFLAVLTDGYSRVAREAHNNGDDTDDGSLLHSRVGSTEGEGRKRRGGPAPPCADAAVQCRLEAPGGRRFTQVDQEFGAAVDVEIGELQHIHTSRPPSPMHPSTSVDVSGASGEFGSGSGYHGTVPRAGRHGGRPKDSVRIVGLSDSPRGDALSPPTSPQRLESGRTATPPTGPSQSAVTLLTLTSTTMSYFRSVSFSSFERQPGDDRLVVRQFIGWAVSHRATEVVMMIVTLVNVVALAVDHHGIDTTFGNVLNITGLVCSAVFLVEVALKLFAFGWRCLLNGFNALDFLLVVISGITIAVSGGALETSKFSAFRALRLLRIFRLLSGFPSLQTILNAILAAVVSIAYLSLLIVLFLYVYAVLGMQVFGTKYGEGQETRDSFGTIWESALVAFIVITGDNWTAKMRTGMSSYTGGFEVVPVIYFVSLYMIGNYILINLSVAIIVDTLQEKMEEQDLASGVIAVHPPLLLLPALADFEWRSPTPRTHKRLLGGTDSEQVQDDEVSMESAVSIPNPLAEPENYSFQSADQSHVQQPQVQQPQVQPLPPFAVAPVRADGASPTLRVQESGFTPPDSEAATTLPPIGQSTRDSLFQNGASAHAQDGDDEEEGVDDARRATVAPRRLRHSPADAPPVVKPEEPRPDPTPKSAATTPVAKPELPPSALVLGLGMSHSHRTSQLSSAPSADSGLGGLGREVHSRPPSAHSTADTAPLSPASAQQASRQAIMSSGTTGARNPSGRLTHRPSLAELFAPRTQQESAIADMRLERSLGSRGDAPLGMRGMLSGGNSVRASPGVGGPIDAAPSPVLLGVGAGAGGRMVSGSFDIAAAATPFNAGLGLTAGEASGLEVDPAKAEDEAQARRDSLLRQLHAQEQLLEEERFRTDKSALRLTAERVLAVLKVLLQPDPLDVTEDSLGVLSPTNPLRRACLYLVCLPLFHLFMFVVIAANVVFLAFDRPGDESNRAWDLTTKASDYVFVGIFSLEIVIHVIAHGALFPGPPDESVYYLEVRQAVGYFRDPWNCVDAFVTVLSIIGLFIPVFRVGRALRAVRLMVRVDSTKVIVIAVIEAIPHVLHGLLVSSVVLIVFAVLGVQLFKGILYKCNDPAVLQRVECVGNFTRMAATALGPVPVVADRVWSAPDFHFDNVGYAMITLFVVTVGDGWSDIMFNAMDATDTETALQRNKSPWYSLYFVTVYICCNFFALNMMVGILINYFSIKKRELDGSALLTEKQRLYVKAREVIDDTLVEEDSKRLPYRLSTIVNSFITWRHEYAFLWRDLSVFEHGVMFFIAVNVIAVAMEYHEMADAYDTALNRVQLACLVIFTLEAAARLVALGHHYFAIVWNLFDFVIVCSGWLALVFPAVTFLTFLRVFRVVKLVRGTGIQDLIQKLVKSVRSLLNVFAIVMLTYFIFAVAGVALFGSVKHNGAIDEHNNFESVPRAMLVLYQCGTTENWHGVMNALSIEEPDSGCSDAAGDCGNWYVARAYFITFIVLCTYIALQLFVAVIVEIFTQEDVEDPLHDAFIVFKQVWVRRFGAGADGTAVHFLDFIDAMEEFPPVLTDLPFLHDPEGVDPPEPVFSRGEVMRLLSSLPIPVDAAHRVWYCDVVNAIAFKKYQVDARTMGNMVGDAMHTIVAGASFSVAQVYAVHVIVDLWRRYKAEGTLSSGAVMTLEEAKLRVAQAQLGPLPAGMEVPLDEVPLPKALAGVGAVSALTIATRRRSSLLRGEGGSLPPLGKRGSLGAHVQPQSSTTSDPPVIPRAPPARGLPVASTQVFAPASAGDEEQGHGVGGVPLSGELDSGNASGQASDGSPFGVPAVTVDSGRHQSTENAVSSGGPPSVLDNATQQLGLQPSLAAEPSGGLSEELTLGRAPEDSGGWAQSAAPAGPQPAVPAAAGLHPVPPGPMSGRESAASDAPSPSASFAAPPPPHSP